MPVTKHGCSHRQTFLLGRSRRTLYRRRSPDSWISHLRSGVRYIVSAVTNTPVIAITNEINAGYAIGDRTIHIDCKAGDRMKNPNWYLFSEEDDKVTPVGFRCQSSISNAKKKERYSERGDPRCVLEEHDDAFELSCAHNACFYGNDTFIYGNLATWRLDLRLLRVSWEANQEATKLFYKTNMFSFKDVPAVYAWLSAIPADMKQFVRSVHLEISLGMLGCANSGVDRDPFLLNIC